METFVKVRDFKEAHLICESLLFQIEEVEKLTKSVSKWIVLDVLFDFIKGFFKRIDMQNVDIHLENIERLLKRLREEIADIQIYFSTKRTTNTIETLVDLVVDFPVFDMLLIFKMKEVRNLISLLKPRIKSIQNRLDVLSNQDRV